MTTPDEGGPSRVFITHSSLDRDIALGLVDAVRLGTGLSHENVFCSSIEGYDVPTGDDFVRYIREQLARTRLVVPLITPAYLDSVFCMWELGAAWVREVRLLPILAPTLKPADLPGLLATTQVRQLDSKRGLNEIAQTAAVMVGGRVNQDLWERAGPVHC